MSRRCSHCSNNGHNSRTCPARAAAANGGGGGGGVRLFGVRLTEGGSIMKKSASMGNISALYHSSVSPNPGSPSSDAFPEPLSLPDGYVSDDPIHASSSTNRRVERKKGVAWTEEEHRLFLVGLQKLGKGDWRGISRNYVISRTPTQVASHAQKYFIRQCNVTRRKRRSSLFDMVAHPDMVVDLLGSTEIDEAEEVVETANGDSSSPPPSLQLSLNTDFESMETTPSEPSTTPFPAFNTTSYIQFPLWHPSNDGEDAAETSNHQILKPIPVVPKEPINVDELLGMSKLSLGGGETAAASSLSLKLTGEVSRPSAFHRSNSAPASHQ